MSAEDILQSMRGVLAAQFEITEQQFDPAAKLGQDLDLDSLDLVVLAMEIGRKLGVDLDEDDVKGCETLADIAQNVATRVSGRG